MPVSLRGSPAPVDGFAQNHYLPVITSLHKRPDMERILITSALPYINGIKHLQVDLSPGKAAA